MPDFNVSFWQKRDPLTLKNNEKNNVNILIIRVLTLLLISFENGVKMNIKFIYLCKIKYKTKMKRNIVIIGAFLMVVLLVSACATRQKCAAYGHYTYHKIEKVEDNSL
ncbi:MAG TPA: hypothetical protein PLH70_06270 [Bacteroidales bacterium]|nr:hypothetical protein [Bacteroidales bacterium]HOH22513.1 hypothetical protein [Bacteroidales bacterium]HPB57831.1 hypothetical protein [Bacteroidales bacterium]HPZ02983.1 hypothetical protein [Bacteroidales bacterium]HQB75387.1 hypothetical protein [Bacteroidales bacterium]